MLRVVKLFFILFCLILSHFSFAQGTSFSGLLVNERNEPLAGAHLKLYKSGKVAELVADNSGVVFTDQIAPGYYFAEIIQNSRHIKVSKICIRADGGQKVIYNFKLLNNTAVITLSSGRPLAQERP